VRAAQLALRYGEIHALHDPTEGGVLSGLYELARAGRVGVCVWKEKIPVLAETSAFRQVLDFDPFALIASGALLVVASPRTVPKLLQAYARNKIPAAVIGEVRPESEGILIVDHGEAAPLRAPPSDEISRLLG
jgi:hydrogenase maturation factor